MPMKKKKISAILAALVLMLLPILFSGCESQGKPESGSSSSQSASTPEPAVTPEPTKEPTPEPTSTPEPSSAPDFEEVFAGNPIDGKLNDDLDAASSTNAILAAYNEAAKSWKTVIPSFYASSLEVSADDAKETLRQEYEAWQNTIEEEVDQVLQERGDDSDSQVSAAISVMEKYREQAQTLCEAIFSSTGELPDFDAALSAGPMG